MKYAILVLAFVAYAAGSSLVYAGTCNYGSHAKQSTKSEATGT